MFARVAAAKGPSPSKTAETVRTAEPVRPSQYSAQQPPRRPIQAKLEVGAVDDPLEREADRAAELVMRMPQTGAAVLPAVTGDELPGVQRKTAAPQISRMGSSSAGSQITAPPSVHEVLNSPGQPLAPATRAFFEPRFGHDFSRVRIHADKAAQSSAASIDAHAYTVGHHVAFGPGRLAPQTSAGRILLAHELAHVIQQGEAAQFQVAPQKETDQKLAAAETGAISAPRVLSPMLSTGVARKLIQRQVIDSRKLRIKSIDTPKHIRVSQYLDEAVPGGGTSRTELYWVDFEVDAKAVMRASVRTVSPDRAYRSGVLKFGDEFKRAVEYFERNGVKVREFEGDWSYMTATEISENLKVFKEGMEQGQTREQAAAGTPSGKVAAKSGFVVTDVENVPESQPHLAQEGVSRWRVKATFRRISPPEVGGRNAAGGGGGKGGGTVGPEDLPAPAAKSSGGAVTPVKPSTPGGTTAGGATQPKGQSGVKPPTGTGAEHGSEVEGGGTTPAPKTPGTASQTGYSGQVAIQIGTGLATVGLSFLAAYLKARVDKKIADKQIAAFLEVARKKINANPDEALKKMMLDPDRTVYAWIHLDSAVITTFGVDNTSPEPTMSASSPILDLGPIEYMFAPVDPSLIDSFPRISVGGSHSTTVRTIVIDILLKTPPLADLIGYAKIRNLHLDDLHVYASGRYQAASSSFQTVLEARQKILAAYQTTNDVYQKLHAEFQIAKKRNDVQLQKYLAEKLLSVAHSLTSITDQLKPIGESIQNSDQNLKYWEHILDLIKPTLPRP